MEPKKAGNHLLHTPEFCPNCSKRYNGAKANVVDGHDGFLVIHVTCPNCQTSVISSISLTGAGIAAVGMLTDLTKEDLGILRRRKTVTIDDAIEMYEFLNQRAFINPEKNEATNQD
jgi:hypothetical protein